MTGNVSQRTEYLEAQGPEDTETRRVATDGATLVAGDTYLAISPRADYQATVAKGNQVLTYVVQPGDFLWLIAETYETDLTTLLALNPQLTSTVIQPGEELKVIPRFHGLTHTVEAGDTLSAIASAYGLKVSDIVEANQLDSGDTLQEGQFLLLPGAQEHQERVMIAANRGENRARAGEAPFIWPITGGLVSSEFGEERWGAIHTGLDIAVPVGTPAAAAAAGLVTFSGWDGGYGYCVIIDHGGGIQTRYAHASKLLVSQGQEVKQGEPVILVGATGNSTGPHLHLEVLIDGTAQNPRSYLP
jgi:murein DD-endopeptidase MepM/ murein hydrolase activator NlpD